MAPFTRRPELRMVAVSRGGPVNVDLSAATRAGVAISFAPGRNATAAAEFAVGMMLAAMRRIPTANAELRDGRWRGDFYAYEEGGIELDGATAGLVGYGAIGRIVARVLRAFGAHVLVSDPYTDPEAARADGVEPVELDELLRRSGVVSLHARLTPKTRHLIDGDRLALLPRGAVLVNTARGGLLDHGPLPEALRTGRLGAPNRSAPGPSWISGRAPTTPQGRGPASRAASTSAPRSPRPWPSTGTAAPSPARTGRAVLTGSPAAVSNRTWKTCCALSPR